MKENKIIKKETLSHLSAFDCLETVCQSLLSGNNNYKERKVLRYEKNNDDLVIDTAFTTDTNFFETGIKDKRYRKDGEWFIVEEYKTKEESIKGHKEWVKLLTGRKLPKGITDIHINKIYYLKK